METQIFSAANLKNSDTSTSSLLDLLNILLENLNFQSKEGCFNPLGEESVSSLN